MNPNDPWRSETATTPPPPPFVGLRPRQAPTVLKVGGSILRTDADYARVARLVADCIDLGPTWTVVSAPFGLTERLLSLAASPDPAQMAALIQGQRDRSGLPRSPVLEAALRHGLEEVRAGRPDALVAWGEQASAAALRSCLHALGIDVPVVELCARTRPPPFEHAVVPGFYLRDRLGRARLLPRGGSDISALLLARWLKASEVRLWKDGGGIRDRGRTIPVLDIGEALAKVGRTVSPLHPAAVRIAAREGIDLVLEDPWQEHPSTRIVANARPVLEAVA